MDEQDESDLAEHRPGQLARAQADALRGARPIRTVLARMFGVHTDERAWRIGADGEALVARRLARLGDEWRFVHSVPVGQKGSDIDHVAIGPPGVFTVNAKHHPRASAWLAGNTLMVNGQRVPYVRNSRHEAERAARLLAAQLSFEPLVWSLVVLVGVKDMTVKHQPNGGVVRVLTPRAAVRRLRRQPRRLTSGQIEQVYEVARRPATWRGG